jgi:hypothetical protein
MALQKRVGQTGRSLQQVGYEPKGVLNRDCLRAAKGVIFASAGE